MKINKKEDSKNLQFKQLNFNPTSFFIEKYSREIPGITNNQKLFNEIVKSEKKNNNYNMARKKLKLKPLNMNRSNFGTNFHPKVDDIMIPSTKTTQELIDYNKANTRNTLLNYYHKNNKNMKIINFVKTNSFDQNPEYIQTNKIISSNESFNNNNTNSLNIQNNNQSENPEKILKRSIKIQKSFLETGQILKAKNFRKSRVDIYEAEIFAKKEVLRNLNYFYSYFFDKEEKNYSKKLNPVFKADNQSNSEKIFSKNSLKGKIEMDNLNRDQFVFSSNYKKISFNRRRLKRNKNNLSFKEIRALSLQGFRRMKADKKRQFDLNLQKTNSEVLNLERKLDKLLEENRLLFLKADGNDL